MRDLRQDHQQRLNVITNAHQREITQLKQEHRDGLAALQQEHERSLEKLHSQSAADLDELRSTHVKEINALQSKLDDTNANNHQQMAAEAHASSTRIETLQSEHQAKLQAQQDDYEKKVANYKKEFELKSDSQLANIIQLKGTIQSLTAKLETAESAYDEARRRIPGAWVD